MRNNALRSWVIAALPALVWLVFRYAGKNLPPAAEICLTGAALAAAAYLLLLEQGKALFRLEWKACLPAAGIGIAMGIASRVCFGKPDGGETSVSAFLLLCVLGPAAEEVLYRGLVYGRCLRFLPGAGAIAVSSLLFAAAHGTPARMAAALAMGVLLGLARRKTGTVTVPGILHMAANLAVFFL